MICWITSFIRFKWLGFLCLIGVLCVNSITLYRLPLKGHSLNPWLKKHNQKRDYLAERVFDYQAFFRDIRHYPELQRGLYLYGAIYGLLLPIMNGYTLQEELVAKVLYNKVKDDHNGSLLQLTAGYVHANTDITILALSLIHISEPTRPY